jgi:hypothetical protein
MIEALERGVLALLAMPRAQQPAAARALHAALSSPAEEPWNSAFGEDSLYAAFTRSTVARGVHAANRVALAPLLARPVFRAIEVGGGNGALWEGLLPADARGEILVVDPHPDGADGVRGRVPSGVTVRHDPTPIQDARLPEADAAVVSLALHHVAGRDAACRARVGLGGRGKREALLGLHAALAPREGTLLVNEADIYCDLGLAPGDPLLAERLVDSYVRRFAVSLLHDLAHTPAPEDVRRRWAAIVRDWALGQVAMAEASWEGRDVYELDVVAWLGLFADTGFVVRRRGFTDPWMLFHQYVLGAPRAAPAASADVGPVPARRGRAPLAPTRRPR